MTTVNLERVHFNISRSAEYFDPKELQAQTGQPVSKFGEVVLKELIDNALDACESADIEPVIHIGMATVDDMMRICVSDNGVGIVKKSLIVFWTSTPEPATRPPIKHQHEAHRVTLLVPVRI